jgi:hypothetical protein
LAGTVGAASIPSSSGFTLSFLMCLIALAAGLGFAVAVPRRRAGERTAVAVLRHPAHAESERSAA